MESIYNQSKKDVERRFVLENKFKLREILGKKCSNCNSNANEIHHITYNIPIKKIKYDKRKTHNSYTLEEVEIMLIKYSKYLLYLCSKCHKEFHLNGIDIS